MMRTRLIELRERRLLLTARAQQERDQLAMQLARADGVLAWFAWGRGALAAASRRPLLLAAAAGLLLILRPRRVVKLLASGWSLWQLYRRARQLWANLEPAIQVLRERSA